MLKVLLKTSTVALKLGPPVKLALRYPGRKGREGGRAEVDHIVVDTKTIRGTDGKDNRIARGLKQVNAQPEKPLHVSRAQIAVGPPTVGKLSIFPLTGQGRRKVFEIRGGAPYASPNRSAGAMLCY